MTPCPDDDELVRMVEGALAHDSMVALEAHVDSCPKCAKLIAELGRMAPRKRPITGLEKTALALGSGTEDTGSPMHDPSVRNVGRYQLDRRIAAGGMGEVWAAWDPKLERDVAIKLVKPERADDGRERDRLLREARALAKLMHPNVLAVHDVGEQDGEVFLACELVPGDTLASRGGASSDWRALARLYVQGARGLAAAHAVGLVHRDVKPANLLVGADGRVRVGDFGLAVREQREPGEIDPVAMTVRSDMRAAGDPQITAPGAVAGTPAYMAPEQRLGVQPDARCDQYALCVALVEGICGRRPTAAQEPAALAAFVYERRKAEPEIDSLCSVLARGLAFEPDDRYPSMAALADAIEAIVGKDSVVSAGGSGGAAVMGMPSATATERVVERAAPASGRRRRVVGGVIAAAGGAAIAALAILYFARPPTTAPAAAPTASPIASPSPSPSPSPSAATDTVAAAGTGTGAATPAAAGSGSAAVGRATGAATVAKAPPKRVAVATGAGAGGAGGGGTIPAGSATPLPPPPPANMPAQSPATSTTAIEAAEQILRRRDGAHCAAAFASIDPSPLSNRDHHRLDIDREHCAMLAGQCAAATQRLLTIYAALSSPPITATFDSEYWCSPDDPSADATTRRKRLMTQTSSFPPDKSACDHYVKSVRAYAASQGSTDPRGAAIALVAIAKCMSENVRCQEAHALLAEAQKFIPKLDTSELTMDCR
jgi:hypothetical protein